MLGKSMIPVASLAAFFALFALISWMLNLEPVPDTNIQDRAQLSSDMTAARLAKLRWGASFFLVGVALMWNAGAALWIISQGATRINTIRALFTTLVIAAVPVAMLLLGWNVEGGVGSTVADVIYEIEGTNVHRFAKPMRIAAFVVAVLIAVSLSNLLDPPQGDTLSKIWKIKQTSEHANLSLYSVLFLLIIGLVEIFFKYSWPAYFYTDQAKVASFIQSAATMTGIAGVGFTVLLLIIYVPIAIAHRKWIIDIRSEIQKDQEETAQQQLGESAFSQFARALAMAMPSVFGFLVEYGISA